MKTTSFRGVCSLLLAFVLTLSVSAAETFQPHEILRVHLRSYFGFIQAMTSFTSQVSPQATGKLLFLSALPSMNPEFAAINLNRPITALLLTGAGTVKNKTGEYAPDLFLCAAVQLRQNADGKASTAGGVRYSRLSLPDGRTLLYEPNPLYDKMIRTKASTLFPVRRDLPMLYLEMDLASLSQLPFIRDGVSQAVASATVENDDLQPEELTRELEKAIRQAEKISFGVNFPNEQTLEIKLGVTLKPGTETVRLFEGQKNKFDFSRIPILRTATEIYLLHIPDNQKLKDFLIRQVRQTTLPAAFLEQCIEASYPLPFTFHRAFDMCREPLEALEILESAGCARLLSSGMKNSALEGTELLKELVCRSGKLIVMPGCGLNAGNIARIARETGAKEFHLSGRSRIESRMQFRNPEVSMGGTVHIEEYAREASDPEKIRQAIEALM